MDMRGIKMKDPEVQEAVNQLYLLVEEINQLNQYLFDQGVNFTIQEKSGGGNAPKTFNVAYLVQTIKYEPHD
jgi:hypothetical protein